MTQTSRTRDRNTIENGRTNNDPETLFHLNIHPVRQRRAPRWARAGVHPDRRLRALSPAAGSGCLLPDRLGRERAQERAGRRGRGHQHPGAGRPQRGRLPEPADAAPLLEQLFHPHQHRPAPPGRRVTDLGTARRGRRCLPQTLHRPLLCRLRGVLSSRRAGGGTLPDPRHQAGRGRRGELLLPALEIRRRAAPQDL